ncbi:glycoside hydrolase family 99-like domain-containing protein [uncultured Desulfobulbus sp.]|uniref:glycoside hydrolase family 99-like domain-containing protein n=1 Tax=uncultured Desulfobulbus sp. TaxID=239745 RepID=UPI0029C77903|nr:glycoside hydrolase family 99-like domain-containing protein [uncultured Desulfobulbus sp.]
MRMTLLLFIVFLISNILSGSPAEARSVDNHPSVGAIRWDGWFAGSSWQKNLQSKEWQNRLPFYTKTGADGIITVIEDSQEVMDKEIVYASRAGIDYWAFCYYHPKSWSEADSYNYGWKRYLASKYKSKLNFCLLLQWGHLGPKDEWDETIKRFISMFKEPTYQRVSNGRPLIYFFNWDYMEKQFGSIPDARKAIDELRTASLKAGTGNPYIVAQVFAAADGTKYIDELGFDAIGAYSAPMGNEHREYSYSELADSNKWYWNSFRATDKKVVPLVNAGWDGRPRDYPGGWYASPKPVELAQNLRSAFDWLKQNPDATDADTVLIYAWNETDEGGWLVPTLSEGTKRLDAIQSVLSRYKR